MLFVRVKAIVASSAIYCIVDLNVCIGVTVFNKYCSKCQISYRYQSVDDGIHNYNDNVFISVPFAIFLRSALKVWTYVVNVHISTA